MKASLSWIKELLPDLKASASAVEKKLNASGTAVDGRELPEKRLEGLVVAEVLSVEPHPKADKLSVTRVFDGEAEYTVVCGAPNVAAGQKAAFAPVGATLPGGLTIEPRPIRGVDSAGMLCSADELGLALDADGIMVLKPRLKPGKPLADALGVKDAIFELDVTPNRPDLLSHFGLARELAALFDLPAPKRASRVKQARRKASDATTLEVIDRDLCPLYAGRVIEGVRVGPSPEWVQRRLLMLGQRPVSNVVDATNLVLLELGQPLHAFDLDRLRGSKIVVRRAKDAERIRLLDKSELELGADDLVIADAEQPVALAGVMGGLDSEVSGETSRLLLESAQFDAASVRRSSKRYGLHTEASHRFERGVDPQMVQTALDACAALIVELAGGEVLSGRVLEEAGSEAAKVVSIRPSRAEALIGRSVSRAEIRGSLRRLGLKAVSAGKSSKKSSPSGDVIGFEIPAWRRDLSREVDLIEEVARMGGYDQIPVIMPAAAPAVRASTFHVPPERRLRRTLAGLGFREAVSLGFTAPGDAAAFGASASELVAIRNPLGEETRNLRFSLLPGLLAAARRNQDALPSVTDLRFFELGRTFEWSPRTADMPVETDRLALLMRGRRRPPSWSDANDALDAHDLVGVLELLCALVDAPMPRIERDDATWLHPRAAGRLVSGDQVVGRFGELHPDVSGAYQLEGPGVFVAELDVHAWASASDPSVFRAIPTRPPAQRDLSFFVDRERPARAVLDTISRAGAERNLESVDLFDVYEGRGVPEGQRSLAVALVFRAAERTLTDAEVDEAQAAIVLALETEHGVTLRSGG